MKPTYIAIPSVSIPIVASLLDSPPRKVLNRKLQANRIFRRPGFWLSFIAFFVVFSIYRLSRFRLREDLDSSCISALPVSRVARFALSSTAHRHSLPSGKDHGNQELVRIGSMGFSDGRKFVATLLSPHPLTDNMSETEKTFWKQPDSLGFKPCMDFSSAYQEETMRVAKVKRKYLMVIVSGGLNQQRNEIVDAVVIARILGAVLVLPILQVNMIWQDDSEFSDIFDAYHFKHVLKDDVTIVSSLPSTHIMTRPVQRNKTPLFASPQWFRRNYLQRLNREGILLLRGMDSRLSKDLPPDLQKLRCKVAFHALRFIAPIMEIGNLLARRMWEKGPYVALHLRLEKDVWVRTGCLPGLTPVFDEEVQNARLQNPQFLTARNHLNYTGRKLAGLCPLNAAEVARILKGLGATKGTNIFWAGGEPLGGEMALRPLIEEFGQLYNKETLALPGELEPFKSRASSLAAIDYIISLQSDVFMPSHGGNMARALQGHRAYAGFRKHITPNKREMLPLFLNASLSNGQEVDHIIKGLHQEAWGQPAFRTHRQGRDVLAYPVPECMCNSSSYE